MRRASKPLPEDPNQRAAEIVRLSTEKTDEPQRAVVPAAISLYFSGIGRKGGLKGGKARNQKLSQRRKREIAKKAAHARWTKESPNSQA